MSRNVVLVPALIGSARLIKFQSGIYRDHLRTTEDRLERDLLIYGEPDLIGEIATVMNNPLAAHLLPGLP
jgi:hypothetical protein